MTVQVHDPRLPGGVLEVDTDDPKAAAQAAQRYLAANPPTAPAVPKPAPSLLDSAVDAARSIPGGLAKGIAQTVGGFGGDVRELADSGVRYFGGDHAAQIADFAMRALPSFPGMPNLSGPTTDEANAVISKPTGGYYRPQTGAGRYAETIASFAPAAVGGEATIPQRIARVAIPAIASQAGGELTAGTPLEPYARVAGAVAGGGLAAAERPAIRSINRLAAAASGGTGFLDPAAEARRALQAAVARDGGVGPVVDNTRSFSDSGASAPTLIDVGGNNVRRLVRAAAAGEGAGQNLALSYADRVRANLQDNVINRTSALTPGTTDSATDFAAQLERQRDQNASTNYAGSRTTPATVTPEMISALQGPEGRSAIGRAYAAARANRDTAQMGELQDLQAAASDQGGDGRVPLQDALGSLSAGTIDRVRIAMRDIGGNLAARGARDIARGYAGRVTDIDSALDQTPELTGARAIYRSDQALVDAVPAGQAALTTPADQYASTIADLAARHPSAPYAAGVGHRQAIVDAVSSPAAGQTGAINRIASSTQSGQNLATSFGTEAAGNYQSALRNEVARLRNANFISPNTGSQTALREADQSGFMGALHFMKSAPLAMVEGIWATIRHGLTLTPAERAQIVQMGTTEADLRALARSPGLSTPARIAIPAAVGATQVNGAQP